MLSLREFGFILPGLATGLTIHEYNHVLVAKLLGDSSAAKAGRLTLNPFKHLVPLGLLALFVLGFGWAKPVVINIYNFKRPRLYFLLTSLAGPFSNLLLAAVIIFSINIVPMGMNVLTVLYLAAYINVVLAVINLLPVPPLDGSRIWTVLFPKLRPVSRRWTNLIIIVFILIVLRFGLLDRIFEYILSVVDSLIFI